MKVKKKAKWIRKAMKEFREYEERVVEFKAGRDSEKLLGFDSKPHRICQNQSKESFGHSLYGRCRKDSRPRKTHKFIKIWLCVCVS
jgi:hypothetical protein